MDGQTCCILAVVIFVLIVLIWYKDRCRPRERFSSSPDKLYNDISKNMVNGKLPKFTDLKSKVSEVDPVVYNAAKNAISNKNTLDRDTFVKSI
jgi:hypothetical protein